MIKERNFTTYILLSIVTCGIYSIIFWYDYAKDMNQLCAGDGENTTDYVTVILLSIVTCGIYPIIWYYKLGDRLQRNAPRYGTSFQENGTTVLMWMILGSLICGIGYYYAQYILIKNINQLAYAYNANAHQNNGQNNF